MMQKNISMPACMATVILFLLFLFGIGLSAHAATVTWGGGGTDNLVSNSANWAGGTAPREDDAVIFDNTSTKDSIWDTYVRPASLHLNQGYTGTVTLNSDLPVIGSVVISDGTLLVKGVLWVGGAVGVIPITLSIDSPFDGATIYRPDATVTGTVTNAGGFETGVTVNGVVANVYGDQFMANHVPLQEGTDVITATGTNTHGGTSTASVTINAVTTGNYIRLTADTESGVAPLEATLRIEGTFSIGASSLSATGPVQPEILSSSADQYKVKMAAEGTYYFTANVTGPDESLYQDTIVISVLNKTTLDNILRSKWTAMTDSLLAGDTATALTYISAGAQTTYQQMFTALGDQLTSITATQRELNFISIRDGQAKYELVTIENGKTYSYEVIFATDSSGLWKIQEF